MSKEIREDVLRALTSLLSRMGLTLNEEKTRRINVLNEPFNFLGFTFHYRKSIYAGDEYYLSIRPSKKAFQKLVANIRKIVNIEKNLSTHVRMLIRNFVGG
jgi:hypothetical protein